MNESLQRFEQLMHTSATQQRGAALHAAARQCPHGYRAWVEQQIAGTPYTAEGFDLARGKLEAAGLSKADALREACRSHPAHMLWVQRERESRSTRRSWPTPRGERGIASAAAPVQTGAGARAESVPTGQIVARGQRLDAEQLAFQRARWEKYPGLRFAFGDNFESFVARCEGRSSPPGAGNNAVRSEVMARDSAEAFDAAIARFQTDGLTRGGAIKKAAHELPEAHAAWIEHCNEIRRC